MRILLHPEISLISIDIFFLTILYFLLIFSSQGIVIDLFLKFMYALLCKPLSPHSHVAYYQHLTCLCILKFEITFFLHVIYCHVLF